MILQILLMKVVNLKKLSLYMLNTRTEVSLVKNVFCQGKKKCLNNSQNQTCHSFKKKVKKMLWNSKAKSWLFPEVLKMSPVLVIDLNVSSFIIHSSEKHVLIWKRSTELNNGISRECKWPMSWLTVWKQIWKFWSYLSSPFCTKRNPCSLLSLYNGFLAAMSQTVCHTWKGNSALI